MLGRAPHVVKRTKRDRRAATWQAAAEFVELEKSVPARGRSRFVPTVERGVWVQVTLRDGESQEQLLKRFRSAVQRAGILQDVKRRRYFVSKSEKARLAQRRALRRARRRAARQR